MSLPCLVQGICHLYSPEDLLASIHRDPFTVREMLPSAKRIGAFHKSHELLCAKFDLMGETPGCGGRNILLVGEGPFYDPGGHGATTQRKGTTVVDQFDRIHAVMPGDHLYRPQWNDCGL